MSFEPEKVLEILERHHVEYVVIGGFGAWLHGAAHVTQDIDITPETSRANLGRLSTALTEMGARIRTDAVDGGLPFAHDGESLGRARVWNLVTDFGDVDLAFEPAGTSGYQDLINDALHVEILNVHTHLASLRDIVRSKEAADRPKDHLALPTLRRLLESQEGRD